MVDGIEHNDTDANRDDQDQPDIKPFPRWRFRAENDPIKRFLQWCLLSYRHDVTCLYYRLLAGCLVCDGAVLAVLP